MNAMYKRVFFFLVCVLSLIKFTMFLSALSAVTNKNAYEPDYDLT